MKRFTKGIARECTVYLLLLVGLRVAGQPASSRFVAVGTPEKLIGLTIPASWFTEPTRGGTVASATLKTSRTDTTVRYVDVSGTINAVDPNAPRIEWKVLLPMNWNGRTLQLGGGANNGSIPPLEGKPSLGTAIPIDAGYVVYGDDSGHQANALDASFALNEEALTNYARQHLIKAHLAMRYVVNIFYGQQPVFNFFAGTSTGGREALECATTYGKYYQGVFCAEPASNYVLARLWGAILSQAVYQSYDPKSYPHSDGFIPEAVVKAIQLEAIARYDSLDGLTDGIVSNVYAARSRRATFLDEITKKYRLTPAQLKTIDVYENGFRLPYKMASNGMKSYQGCAALEGGEMDLGPDPVPREPLDTKYNVHHGDRADGIFKYFFMKDPHWKLIDHDYYHPDKKLYKALMQASTKFDVNAPKFDDFIANRGKLILFTGWQDMSMSPWQLIRQYKGYVTKYGQAMVDSFCKFYIMPGVTHGSGIEMDYLSWLDQWCTTGSYPTQTLYGKMSQTGHQMPMATLPGWVKYVGGDPRKGSSYSISTDIPTGFWGHND